MKRTWLPLAMAAALYGADVTGNWTGNVEVTDPGSGEKIITPVKAQFEQAASTVSGKIGRAQDQELEAIRNGKLDGDTLTFEVQPPEATSPMKFNLVLVRQDHLEGEMRGAIDSGNIAGKVTLDRARQ